MINFKIQLSLVLLAVVSLSACSSSPDSEKNDHQVVLFEDTVNLSSSDTPISAFTLAESNSDEITSGQVEYLRVKHHQVECEGFQVSHCLLIQKEGSDDWVVFYDQIEGFDYEWGKEYEILVQVQDVDSGLADASNQRYSLFEMISKINNVSNEAFLYTSYSANERISEIAPGQFSLLGNQDFTCTVDSCDNIRSSIAQNQSVLLSFQHSTNSREPLVLQAVLCSDSRASFTASCL